MTYLRIVIPYYWSMIPAFAGAGLFRKPVSTLAFARGMLVRIMLALQVKRGLSLR